MSGDPAKHEVNQYLMEPCIEDNPLGFWGSNENNYPWLRDSLQYLPLQHQLKDFSIAGKIFRLDGCRLSDNTFHKLIMIECNSNF